MPPFQVGITGGIGSGKSLICKIFQVLEISVYDADSRAKYVMTTDGILVSQIRKEFGELSYHKDGQLDRVFLSEQVFNHPERLEKLNKMVHPRVEEDYQQWVAAHANERYVIKEAALLFETGSYKRLNYVVLVSSPEELRIGRVLKRDKHRSIGQVREIINRQMPEAAKQKIAQSVIWNDELQLVIPQVLKLHGHFSSL